MSDTIIDKLNQIQQIKNAQYDVLENAGVDMEGKTYSDFPALFGQQIQDKNDLSNDISAISGDVQYILSNYIKDEASTVDLSNSNWFEFEESLNKVDIDSAFTRSTTSYLSSLLYRKVYLSANTEYKFGCFQGIPNKCGMIITGVDSLSNTALITLPLNWTQQIVQNTMYDFSTSALTADGWYYFRCQYGNGNFTAKDLLAYWLFVPASTDVDYSKMREHDDFAFYRHWTTKPSNSFKYDLTGNVSEFFESAAIKPVFTQDLWPNNAASTRGIWVKNSSMKGDQYFYKVEPGAKYYYYNDSPGAMYIYFYEEGYQKATSGDITADGVVHEVKWTRIGDKRSRFLTVPQNAHYVRFGTAKTTTTDNMMLIRCNEPIKPEHATKTLLRDEYVAEYANYKPLEGAKLVYDGDSVIKQSGTNIYISEDLGVNVLSNIAEAGYTIASLATQEHVDQIPLDTDIVLVVIGTNDCGSSYARPLGQLSSTHDLSTFYGAYQLYLDMVFTRVPTATVVVATPPFKLNEDTTITSEDKTMEDYRQAIRDIAKKYACPIVELKQNMGVNQINYGYFSQDGIHYGITTAGTYRMARTIEPVLKSIGYYGTYSELPTLPLSADSIKYYGF